MAESSNWRHRIDAAASERGDLDILLKDDWRHRIVVRDDGIAHGPVRECEAHLHLADDQQLVEFLGRGGPALRALMLTALHKVLQAYGNGGTTVVACVAQDGGQDAWQDTGPAGVHPSIVDHRAQSALSAGAALEAVTGALGAGDAFVPGTALLGQGHFDAVLVDARCAPRLDLDRVPLVLVVDDEAAPSGATLRMHYCATLFEDAVMAGFLDILVEVARQIVQQPECLMARLELTSAEQRAQLLQWNATDGDFPQHVRLESLVEEAARRSPDHCAVVCGEQRVSYADLMAMCDRLAVALSARGVAPGEVVGLYLDKSHRVVVAALALWKTGAAYTPFDPSYPAERIQFTMRDTGAKRILTHRHHADAVHGMVAAARPDVELLDIDALLCELHDGVFPAVQGLDSTQHAYVTYTSGTTGVPKGVAKTHRSVVNAITDLSVRYDMCDPHTEVVALFAAVVFEPFMRQTLIALINHQTLVVVPDDVRVDPIAFPRFVAEHGISYLNGTRSVLQHFELRDCSALKRMLLVGEELTPKGLQTLRERFTGRVINEYAFTETAFVTACKEYAPGESHRRDRSIGRPLRNVKCYVLGHDLKQVPIGAIGELYIGGEGVAAGYLNRPELTAAKFLDNPFRTPQEHAAGTNARMYRTGDLARFLADGQLEFMGRADFQLKLNGIRVEPGEIEARALEFPGMQQCIVVPRGEAVETGNWHLVGYYTCDDAAPVDEDDLLAFLESRLIRVMVPARMVRMQHLPVNVNGKIDRRALPDVGAHSTRAPDADPVARTDAAGPVETLRAEWAQVLGLRTADIGDDDDFFRLGGQSITCLRLIMRVWQCLRVVISVEDVYRLKTFAQLAHHLMLKIDQAAQAPLPDVDHENDDQASADGGWSLPATGLQQGLLYQSMKSEAGDDAYVMQTLHHYHRPIDVAAMRQAWSCAQRRYPALSLRFDWHERPMQHLDASPAPLDWREVDLRGVADAALRAELLQELQRDDRREPYRLGQGRLLRIYLIRQPDNVCTILFSCHHIIVDGWSLPLLHDAVHRDYIDIVRGVPVRAGHDAAYATAQRYLLAHRDDHLDYWAAEFERIDERGDLAGLVKPERRYSVDVGGYDRIAEHRVRTLTVDATCTTTLRAWCASGRVTLHSVLQFAWHTLLFAVGGSRITSVGTVISGRGLPIDGIEESVGLHINTLPSIVDHEAQSRMTVAQAIASIQDAINRMNSRSTIDLFTARSGGAKRRLFETLLVLENYPLLLGEEEAALHAHYLGVEKSWDSDKVNYPIAVVARETQDELEINLWYAGELIDDATAENLLGTLDALLRQVAANPHANVPELTLISSADAARFARWNETRRAYPQDQSLHGIFEQVATAWPDVVTVVAGDRRMTYRQLDERANRLARHLLECAPLRADALVALVVDKSEWMITAMLAVWKAGAAFVPIDPAYPDDRLRFILEDTRTALVLSDREHAMRVGRTADGLPCEVIALQDAVLPSAAARVDVPVKSTDLAYAIYTSGTTGRPKAVLVEHRGVVNLHASLASLFSLRRSEGVEVVLSFSNYTFDHFIEQMTDALLSGQTLVMLDDAMRSDAVRLYDYMNRNAVTYLSGTPSVLSMYRYASVPSLKRIDAIGEDFTTAVFNGIRSSFDGLIINGYGPTEISITSHKRLYRKDEPRLDKSIGHPVANTHCYVVNPAMQRVPVGGIGELYIGGDGVARGYLNRDDLTRERFVANRFQTTEDAAQGRNARLYRTGDLVRWLPNGELEYLGRNDMQVKIRGQRVELGEIESVLASFPGVGRAVVIARDYAGTADGGAARQKYLVAFYVATEELQETALLDWLHARLPQAIVPVRVIRLLEVPVTGSGKLDVKRLPPTDAVMEATTEHVPPANQTERALCLLWANVIGYAADSIGTRNDFFGVGGDSLRAIRLAQAITTRFGRAFSVASVFACPDIQSQAARLKLMEQEGDVKALAPGGLSGGEHTPVRASLAQERLLFIDEFVGGSPAYNISFAFVLALDPVDGPERLERALRTLLIRHAALRTLLDRDDQGRLVQRVMPSEAATRRFSLGRARVVEREALDAALAGDATKVFTLSAELPFRAALYTLGEEHIVSLVFHHTCFDGWSWRVFREELQHLLEGGDAARLCQLPASYADFSVWQRHQLNQHRQEALGDYWLQTLEGWRPLDLPLDLPRPSQFDYKGREITLELDPATTDQLRMLARTTRCSLFSVVLAAYYLTMRAFSGQDDFVVGTPSAQRGHGELEGVVGFFANLLVLRARVDMDDSLQQYLGTVGASVVQAQLHDDLPFEQLVGRLRVPNDPGRHPVVQTVFSLLDRETASAASPAMQTYTPDTGGVTTAKFDLSTTVSDLGRVLSVNVTYASSLFSHGTAESIASTFARVLSEFTRLASTAQTSRLAEILYLPAGNGAQGAPAALPHTGIATAHALFEHHARMRSDRTALVHGTVQLSYAQLDGCADRLCDALLGLGRLRPGNLVALVLEKSEWMIISILAVWKAGAAYVPLDPAAPDERLAFMLQDSGAKAILADSVNLHRMRSLHPDTAMMILDPRQAAEHGVADATPRPAATADAPAYAIYTSGTTGRPKAVLVAHRNVLTFQAGLAARYFGDDPQPQVVLLQSSYVFDFSVEQMALSLLSGHTLLVPEDGFVCDDAFIAMMNAHRLSYLSGTPTQLQLFDLARLQHLQVVLVAGEAFRRQHFDRIRSEFGGMLYSAYGTTETTVYNLVRAFPPGAEYSNDLGEPLPGSRLHLLDDLQRELPTGAVGEICLSGPCVGAGYLNQVALERERFLQGVFPDITGVATLYRTGDLARRRADGALQFLGRNDHQVKINGIRLEPAEIEATVSGCPGVIQCAVVVVPGTTPDDALRLSCYYLAEPQLEEQALLSHMRARLSPAMMPSRLHRIEGLRALPVTVTGKLDVKALASYERGQPRVAYAAPADRMEMRLCRIWSEVLRGKRIGVNDDFFEAGGDSISALHLVSHTRRRLARKVSVKDVFSHTTIREFYQNVLLGDAPLLKDAPYIVPQGERALLPIQAWFFAKSLSDKGHWNQSLVIRTPALEVTRLQAALDALAKHHDAFRLRYRVDGEGMREPVQFYAGHGDIALRVIDMEGKPDAALDACIATLHRRFDLERGPLWEAVFLHGLEDGSARLWMQLHHLIVDAVSWEIICRDLEGLYHCADLGTPVCDYGRWSEAVEAYPASDAERLYWDEIVEQVKRATPVGPVRSAASCRHQFTLDPEDSAALYGPIHGGGDASGLDMMLAALAQTLASMTGRRENFVTLECHGREAWPGAPDVQDTVGWFTTMYPLPLLADDDPLRCVESTHSTRTSVPCNGIGYGAVRGMYGSTSAPLPDVSFNYLGQFGEVAGTAPQDDDEVGVRWQLDPARCGSSRSPEDTDAAEGSVDITAKRIGDRLVVEVEGRIGAQATADMAELLRQRMLAIGAGVRMRPRADVSRGTPPQDEFEPCIVVNEHVAGPTLFLLPPGEGGAESYLANLARKLPHIRLVLFNNIHLHSPMPSFETIAAYYLDHVRRLQPHGPISLAGWSFGGVVALEMACRLAMAGTPVANLFMVDAFFCVPRMMQDLRLPDAWNGLDRINHRYLPDNGALRALADAGTTIRLFKAVTVRDEECVLGHRDVFEYYARSANNHLDLLIPTSSFAVTTLGDSSHFSWVHDAAVVDMVAADIRRHVQDTITT
nr:non-ribosomal peptide synthetase [Luteimonas sp. XNQY3]